MWNKEKNASDADEDTFQGIDSPPRESPPVTAQPTLFGKFAPSEDDARSRFVLEMPLKTSGESHQIGSSINMDPDEEVRGWNTGSRELLSTKAAREHAQTIDTSATHISNGTGQTAHVDQEMQMEVKEEAGVAPQSSTTGSDRASDRASERASRRKSELQSVASAARVFYVAKTIRVVGALLALCAGLVNGVAMYALGVFVSHATGTLTKVGLGLQDEGGTRFDALQCSLLLLSFLGGSALCGSLIGKNTIHVGLALYDFGLLGVSGLLVAACFTAHESYAMYFASAACGLQNGLATDWGGAVIRTTHVTGLFTDVGLLIGRLVSVLLRKRCGQRFDDIDRCDFEDNLSKLSVLLTLGASYLSGAYIGAHLYDAMHEKAFLVPASMIGLIGLSYSIYRVVILRQTFFSDAEMEIVDVPNHMINSILEDAEFELNQDVQEKSIEDLRHAFASSKSPSRAATRSFDSAHGGAIAVVSVPRRTVLLAHSKSNLV